MATYQTREVLEEIAEILKANPQNPTVTINRLVPLAEASGDVLVDISLESVILNLTDNATGREGYLRTFLIHIHVGVESSEDLLRLFDVVDSLENSILADSDLWKLVTDRDIATLTYDHAKTLPYRGATILMEARVKLSC